MATQSTTSTPGATSASGTASTPSVAESLALITDEVRDVIATLVARNDSALDAAAVRLRSADRVFVLGAGRSGLALRMTAMRLMHLGLDVHVVGDVTTPAITAGDVLLVASGSGTTGAIVRAADTAASVGAEIVAVTTAPRSRLAELADVTIVVPAAQKTDHDGNISAQYSGALFEQVVTLLGDALFHSLWQQSGASADELWPRHANLE
ncbi:6-phospho-3-hexuloisomerase [Cryobacterium frigoriphilum]|uniref:6-phospho-3-hexuloisomerase n=1 Tax=Cryobacterium frigoriphilum TaxID=1259150 RepID=A0A4R8ZWI5_9MICO|nr:6-phospho-3-hexuloisomerase [Cryobacterium frigoriphilum]TFD47874.1 6-phospho-3-hexuloisomerase [Cryobacterium frigoriphilum]